VSKVNDHRAALHELGRTGAHGRPGELGPLDDWMTYLSAHSGLPGPRGNLELVAACAEEADVAMAEDLVATGDEFATMCGAVALGRYLGRGDRTHLDVLHRLAGDDRWRVREGAAMALQRAGTTTWAPVSRSPRCGPATTIRWCDEPRWRPSASRGCCATPLTPGGR
jgi:hypothetical protein